MLPLPTILALFSLLVNKVSANVYCGGNLWAEACWKCIEGPGRNASSCGGQCVMVWESPMWSCKLAPHTTPTFMGPPTTTFPTTTAPTTTAPTTTAPTTSAAGGVPDSRRRGGPPAPGATPAPTDSRRRGPGGSGGEWIVLEKHDSPSCSTPPAYRAESSISSSGNQVAFNTDVLNLTKCTEGFWLKDPALVIFAKMYCNDQASHLAFYSNAACAGPEASDSWDFKRRTVAGIFQSVDPGHCEEGLKSPDYFKTSWYGIQREQASISTPCGRLGFCICAAGHTLLPEKCAKYSTDKDGKTVCDFSCGSVEAHHQSQHDYASCNDIKNHYTHSMGCCTIWKTTTPPAPAPAKRCGRISVEKYAAMSAKGLVPRSCPTGVPTTGPTKTTTTIAPSGPTTTTAASGPTTTTTQFCCPNECPVGPTGKALYESFYCKGFTPMLCKKDNVGGPKCGVCNNSWSFSIGGHCGEAYWITAMSNPHGGPFYSKKFCEEENGKVIDATYYDSGCTNEMSRSYQGSVFRGDPCNCK